MGVELMFEQAAQRLLREHVLDDVLDQALLAELGLSDSSAARDGFASLQNIPEAQEELSAVLGSVLAAISQTAAPDASLKNFVRYVQSVDDPAGLFRFLDDHPRAVAFLARLFVSSQFLSDLLLRHPSYLQRMTVSKRLAEIKTCRDFSDDMLVSTQACETIEKQCDALRRVHRWELLRIAACDTFGLMDMARVTGQLSSLADATVQSLLTIIVRGTDSLPEASSRLNGLAVLALGKLGGEELNYSSDIDLVLVSDGGSRVQTRIAQQLTRELSKSTAEGFLYRVDLRLRPWGASGPLVSELAGFLEYLDQSAESWERQAMIKIRPIAGDVELGRTAVDEIKRRLLGWQPDKLESSIRLMKERIEAQLSQPGPDWTEVKSGPGSIRDIEFVTQYLQLRYAQEHPSVLQTNTLQALRGLAAVGVLKSADYHKLWTGYLFLRTVEHALQLMHNKQVHQLPQERGELDYLARRLDFPNAELFREHCYEHCRAVRDVFNYYFKVATTDLHQVKELPGTTMFLEHGPYLDVFSQEQRDRHETLLGELKLYGSVMVEPVPLEGQCAELTVVAEDQPGLLSAICGLLFVYGVDIVSGHAFTTGAALQTGRCVDVFEVQLPANSDWDALWSGFHADLLEHVIAAHRDGLAQVQASLARRVADTLQQQQQADEGRALLPVDISLNNDRSTSTTLIAIEADDTIGFLYELANALFLARVSIRSVVVRTRGDRVFDTLEVTDQRGQKIVEEQRLLELQAVVVLIKHFTHLLPQSPNPESAMLQFRELLERLLEQPDWTDQLASLEQPAVLRALSQLLGVSEFLWEDFLKLQHDNLFPVLAEFDETTERRGQQELRSGLVVELSERSPGEPRVECLNAFKDRQMFLADMRHILVPDRPFGEFAEELCDVTEVVIQEAMGLCCEEMTARFGLRPPGHFSICAMGKFGGRELGFASDIELLCIYDESDVPSDVSAADYYRRMSERLLVMIRSRRDGIFEIDMRLRPHGQAGPLAVSRQAFAKYFAADGPAWPFERQALVKLRAVGGDEDLGGQVEGLRAASIYADGHFDVAAMRAMRDRQVRQLVAPGTINAKLSAGGLVDIEYLVQGLQMVHGHRCVALQTTNTLEAIEALAEMGELSVEQSSALCSAYVFQRRLIDALRMVRGDARDLAVPRRGTREFVYLARRLGITTEPEGLGGLLEHHFRAVEEMRGLLEPATPGAT